MKETPQVSEFFAPAISNAFPSANDGWPKIYRDTLVAG